MTIEPKPVWVEKAIQYVGTTEFKGLRHNPIIVGFWKLIKRGGIRDDETPWCSAFVGGVLEQCGIQSSRNEGAISYREWGVPCLPMYGAIAVMSRPGGNHVFFAVGTDKSQKYILGLGGNQNDSVTFALFDATRVRFFRWPKGIPLGQPLPIVNAQLILQNQRMD